MHVHWQRAYSTKVSAAEAWLRWAKEVLAVLQHALGRADRPHTRYFIPFTWRPSMHEPQENGGSTVHIQPVRLRDGVRFSELDGDGMLIDLDAGRCYAVTGSGVDVVRMVAEGWDIRTIVETLCCTYGVGRSRLENDVTALVHALLDRGLVRDD